jgi:hypothetical protein
MILRDKNECLTCGFIEPPMISDGEKSEDKAHKALVGTTITTIKPLSNHYLDLHNNAFKFRILKDKPMGKAKEGFKGNLTWLTFKGHRISKGPNWLTIYNKKRDQTDTNHLEEDDNSDRENAINIAVELSQCYKLEVNQIPFRQSENRPEVKLVNIVSDVNFHEDEVKAVYPLPSPIEFTGKNAIRNTLNFTGMLDILHSDLDKLTHELKIHSEVENRANEFLKKANEKLTPKKVNPILAPLESLLKTTIQLRDEIND